MKITPKIAAYIYLSIFVYGVDAYGPNDETWEKYIKYANIYITPVTLLLVMFLIGHQFYLKRKINNIKRNSLIDSLYNEQYQ